MPRVVGEAARSWTGRRCGCRAVSVAATAGEAGLRVRDRLSAAVEEVLFRSGRVAAVAKAQTQATKHGFTPRLAIQPMHELDLPRAYRTIYICGAFGIGGRRDHDREALATMRRSNPNEAAVREMARRMVARTPNRGASARNHWLLEGADDMRFRLGDLTAPALVIHGLEDRLFPPGHREALAHEIPSAELLLLEGVGHQAPPRSTWDVVVPAILRHTDHRVRFAHVFEAEARAHDERFRTASGVGPYDRVLDIGCGTGVSTREAARSATAGSAVGVDISGVAIEEARRLSEAESLSNVSYIKADAQVHSFPPAHFDLCISRFGVMFFTDPVAAFTNLRPALRPGARLVLLVWQGRHRNEGPGAIRRALGVQPPASVAGADPFSLGDPRTAENILAAAGFTDVVFHDVHEPVFYGPDVATAYDFVLGLRDTRELLTALDLAKRGPARDRLRALLAAHETESGVLFDARTWIITARVAAVMSGPD